MEKYSISQGNLEKAPKFWGPPRLLWTSTKMYVFFGCFTRFLGFLRHNLKIIISPRFGKGGQPPPPPLPLKHVRMEGGRAEIYVGGHLWLLCAVRTAQKSHRTAQLSHRTAQKRRPLSLNFFSHSFFKLPRHSIVYISMSICSKQSKE